MINMKSDLNNSRSFKEKLLDGVGMDDSQIINTQDLFFDQNDPSLVYEQTDALEIMDNSNATTLGWDVDLKKTIDLTDEFNDKENDEALKNREQQMQNLRKVEPVECSA